MDSYFNSNIYTWTREYHVKIYIDIYYTMRKNYDTKINQLILIDRSSLNFEKIKIRA